MTFTGNPRANSTAMANHLGGEELLVSLSSETTLQLIIISPLAFTNATTKRQKPNKPEVGISFSLESTVF